MAHQMKNGIRTFNGAIALITGGASGIGRALGEALAARGAAVVLADIHGDGAEAAAAEISKKDGAAEGACLDVTDAAAVECVVRDTCEKHGRLDYLFNNAGIGISGDIQDFRREHWESVMHVNLRGVVHGTQAALPVMLRQGFGHIVNTSSMGGLIPFPLTASYTASKFAVYGLSLANRIELMDAGIRVSVICPGVVRTPLLVPDPARVLFPLDPAVAEDVWEKFRPMVPAKFAARVLAKVARNRAVIIEPQWWTALWWLARVSPALTLWLLKRFFYDVGKRQIAEHAKKISQGKDRNPSTL